MRRYLLLLLTSLLAAALFAVAHTSSARADDDGDGRNRTTNIAEAINTTDQSSLFKFKFSLRFEHGDVVDHKNHAVAYSRCTDCRTTAIAVQIVLVTGKPQTVTPENLAVAVNDNCTRCQTFATARQFVESTGGPVELTEEGEDELDSVERALRSLKREELSPAELDARVDAQMVRIRQVLDTELEPRGGEGDDRHAGSDDEHRRATDVETD
jgi:hypothetical protein